MQKPLQEMTFEETGAYLRELSDPEYIRRRFWQLGHTDPACSSAYRQMIHGGPLSIEAALLVALEQMIVERDAARKKLEEIVRFTPLRHPFKPA